MMLIVNMVVIVVMGVLLKYKPSDIHCNGDEDEHGADGGDNCGDGDEDVDGVANKM